jgi:hypothetical protein
MKCKGNRICEKEYKCWVLAHIQGNSFYTSKKKTKTQSSSPIATPQFEEFVSTKYATSIAIPKVHKACKHERMAERHK